MVEALLGAKHGGERAFDLFWATVTYFEPVDGNHWEEKNARLTTQWEAHPDLDLPNFVVRAARRMGVPDASEMAQGKDYWRLDENDLERREGERKQRQNCSRAALMVWPRRARAAIMDLGSLLELLEAAIQGDEDALVGYPDVGALHAVCAARDGWSATMRLRLLSAALDPRIGLDACVAAIRQLPVLSWQLVDVVPVLVGAFSRHRSSATAVWKAVVGSISARLGQSERGDTAAWGFLKKLSVEISKLKDPDLETGSSELVERLVMSLSAPMSGLPMPGDHPDKLIARRSTLTAALAFLDEFGLTDALEKAAALVARNTQRFNALNVIPHVLTKMRKTRPVTPGADVKPWLKVLSQAIVGVLGAAGSCDYDKRCLSMMFSVLLDTSDAADGLAESAARVPVGNLVAAATELLADYRQAMLAEAAWPRVLLSMFEKMTKLPSSTFLKAPCTLTGKTVPQGDTFLSLYILLGSFDAGWSSSPPGSSSPSYREQLSKIVIASGWDLVKVVAPILLDLAPKLDITGRKHAAFRALLQPTLEAMRRTTGSISMASSALNKLEEIDDELTAPSKYQPVTDARRYERLLRVMREEGHPAATALAQELASDNSSAASLAAAIADPSTAASQAAKTARAEQEAGGAQGAAELEGEALVKWAVDHLPAGVREEASRSLVEEEVDEMEALRWMTHAELSETLLGRLVAPVECALFIGIRRLWHALRHAETARDEQEAGGARGAAVLEGGALVEWVVSHFPHGTRAGVARALVEKDCAEMDVLTSMTFAELVRRHLIHFNPAPILPQP